MDFRFVQKSMTLNEFERSKWPVTTSMEAQRSVHVSRTNLTTDLDDFWTSG